MAPPGPNITAISAWWAKSGGVLGMVPLPELEVLRRASFETGRTVLTANSVTMLDMGGDSIEIAADIDMGEATEFRLTMLSTPDREEETSLVYNRSLERLSID